MKQVKEFEGFSKEMQRETDRGLAVLGHAMLDGHLNRLLAAFLVTDQKHVEDLLTHEAMGFSMKLRWGFALGLLSRRIYEDLKLVTEIRNEFAHGMFGLSFAEGSIDERCMKLRLVADVLKHSRFDSGARERYTLEVFLLGQRLELTAIQAGNSRRQVPRDPTVTFGFDA